MTFTTRTAPIGGSARASCLTFLVTQGDAAYRPCFGRRALIGASDGIEATVRRERDEAARQSHPLVVALARGDGAGSTGLLAPTLTAGAADSHLGGWLDVIAVAASQARDHAEKAAVTEIGLATVEQFTADIVRLGRAYVSAPPLPLFAAMHGRI